MSGRLQARLALRMIRFRSGNDDQRSNIDQILGDREMFNEFVETTWGEHRDALKDSELDPTAVRANGDFLKWLIEHSDEIMKIVMAILAMFSAQSTT